MTTAGSLTKPSSIARASGYSGTVSGFLTTTPGIYQIVLYETPTCEPSGYGAGQTLPYKSSGQVTVPGSFTVMGQNTVSFTIAVGKYNTSAKTITATATDAAGDTSEFSACLPYSDDQIFYGDFEISPP